MQLRVRIRKASKMVASTRELRTASVVLRTAQQTAQAQLSINPPIPGSGKHRRQSLMPSGDRPPSPGSSIITDQESGLHFQDGGCVITSQTEQRLGMADSYTDSLLHISHIGEHVPTFRSQLSQNAWNPSLDTPWMTFYCPPWKQA